MGVAMYELVFIRMGCFESRRTTTGASERSQQQAWREQLDQSEIKVSEQETVSYHPDRDKKLTMSMVSSKDKRYWEYDFKGT